MGGIFYPGSRGSGAGALALGSNKHGFLLQSLTVSRVVVHVIKVPLAYLIFGGSNVSCLAFLCYWTLNFTQKNQPTGSDHVYFLCPRSPSRVPLYPSLVGHHRNNSALRRSSTRGTYARSH